MSLTLFNSMLPFRLSLTSMFHSVLTVFTVNGLVVVHLVKCRFFLAKEWIVYAGEFVSLHQLFGAFERRRGRRSVDLVARGASRLFHPLCSPLSFPPLPLFPSLLNYYSLFSTPFYERVLLIFRVACRVEFA